MGLRIGILCHSTYGGSGVIAAELGMALAKWGHCVHFFSYGVPSRINIGHPMLRVHEVEGLAYPLFKYPPYVLALASRLIEVYESEGLDVVHAHYAIPHSISAYLAKQSVGGHFKTVTTLHGTDITLVGADRSYFPMTRLGIESSDAVTAVSNSLKRETIEVFHPTKDIEVIYNFVDTEIFIPAKDRPPHAEKLLLHVSNFRPVKKVDEIVRAFQIVQKSIPSRLCLVGEGPELAKIQALVKELGLHSKVDFLGNQTTIHNILPQADLYVLASETESFGLSALEAMACAVPVVAPKAGGLPEVVVDGETGILVPGGRAEDLANACLQILKDRDLWNRLSRASRLRVLENFQTETIAKQYLRLYERVLRS